MNEKMFEAIIVTMMKMSEELKGATITSENFIVNIEKDGKDFKMSLGDAYNKLYNGNNIESVAATLIDATKKRLTAENKKEDFLKAVKCLIVSSRFESRYAGFASTKIFDMMLLYYTENTPEKFVKKDTIERLHVNEDELYFNALRNTQKENPIKIHVEDSEKPKSYVLETENCNGSIAIFYENVLADIATKEDSDLYVVPVNTALTVVVSAKEVGLIDVKCLKEDMFKFQAELHLSNKIFRFSKSENALYEVTDDWSLKFI